LGGARVRGRIRVVGGLAFVETELGERAVVPVSSLCKLLSRFGIEIVEGEKVECPDVVEVGVNDVELSDEDSGEFEE
jgi:hypothetical protein